MYYKIHYSCLSHIGNVRSINQDNFICDGRYMNMSDIPIEFPLCGTKHLKIYPCSESLTVWAAKNAAKSHHTSHLKLP